MGDQGEYFRDLREFQKDERQRRRIEAPRILAQHDVGFRSHNGGSHLVVRGRVDFWPGTGRWQERPTDLADPNGKTRYGRGIFSLLRFLGVETNVKDIDE